MKQYFDEDYIKSITELVESKSSILKNSDKYEKISKTLNKELENFENKLPEEMKNEFTEILRLMYISENYYETLAYTLGVKYSNMV